MSESKYAGFWIRTGAAIIDTLLVLALIAPMLTAIYGADYWAGDFSTQGIWDILLNYVLPVIVVIVFWIYRSATPGKIVLKLSIVDAKTGGKPSIGQFIGRYFAYYISMIPLFLGFFWVGIDKRKQGWHDKLAGTVVVRGNSSESTIEHGAEKMLRGRNFPSDLAKNFKSGVQLLFLAHTDAGKYEPSLRFVCISLVLCLLIVAGFD